MNPLRLACATAFVGGLAVLVAACGGGSAALPTPTASPTPAPTPAPPTPTPTPTPPPPSVELTVAHPRQGGFVVVRLEQQPPGTQEATAVLAGESYQMAPDGDGWLGVIGLATDLPAGDYTLEVLADGSGVGSAPVSVTEGGFEQLTLTVPQESLDLLSDEAAVKEERRLVAEAYSTFTPERLWSGEWLWPVEGPISNGFGVQRSVNGGPFETHGGADIVAEGDAPVVAAASGRVALAQALYLLGNSVIIDHGAGLLTGYHHMSSIAVSAGQEITKGDLVGYVGATGFVSGDHLHWEARIHGVKVDATLLTLTPLEP